MSSLVVLKKLKDGTYGLLNIIDSGDELTQAAAAQKFVSGWQGIFPADVITVKKAYADKCRSVNNLDGYPDKVYAQAAE